jgi:hypothetical protein
MLGLRLRPSVHAALAGGTLVLTGGCPSHGDDTGTDTDTDTDTDSGTGTGTDTEDPTAPTTTLSPTTITPTTEPPPPPPPPDTTPPALIAVELLDPQILRLTFTEALGPVDQVNPKRFRMSLARYQPQYYYNTPRTGYYDIDLVNYELDCEYVCYYDYCYEQCTSLPGVAVDAVDVLPDAYNPAQAIVLLSSPIFPRTCQVAADLANEQPPGSRGGLFLHYAGGGNAEITDTVGLPLPSIGIEWIKTPENYTQVYYANFPDMNPFLPIPCPFF